MSAILRGVAAGRAAVRLDGHALTHGEQQASQIAATRVVRQIAFGFRALQALAKLGLERGAPVREISALIDSAAYPRMPRRHARQEHPAGVAGVGERICRTSQQTLRHATRGGGF